MIHATNNDTPITLVCGYLGSGKTTLINRILNNPASPKRLAVLVNDFGELNIDSQLIERRSSSDQIVSLTNGCVCCKIQDDLVMSLEQIRSTRPDHVIIEASGVAVPSKLKRPGLLPGFDLRRCAVLIDAKNFQTKKNDKFVGYLVKQQAEEADLIVLTKLDLEPTFKYLSDSSVHQIDVRNPELIRELLQQTTPEPTAETHTTEVEFASCTLGQPKRLSRESLEDLLRELPSWVERVKGFVETNQGLLLVQGSNSTYTITQHEKPERTGIVVIFPSVFKNKSQDLLNKSLDWTITK